jgi:hypothetical protein
MSYVPDAPRVAVFETWVLRHSRNRWAALTRSSQPARTPVEAGAYLLDHFRLYLGYCPKLDSKTALRYFPGAMCPHGRHTARQFFKQLIAYEIKILLSRQAHPARPIGATRPGNGRRVLA